MCNTTSKCYMSNEPPFHALFNGIYHMGIRNQGHRHIPSDKLEFSQVNERLPPNVIHQSNQHLIVYLTIYTKLAYMLPLTYRYQINAEKRRKCTPLFTKNVSSPSFFIGWPWNLAHVIPNDWSLIWWTKFLNFVFVRIWQTFKNWKIWISAKKLF
jgi:hypothetical protein